MKLYVVMWDENGVFKFEVRKTKPEDANYDNWLEVDGILMAVYAKPNTQVFARSFATQLWAENYDWPELEELTEP